MIVAVLLSLTLVMMYGPLYISANFLFLCKKFFEANDFKRIMQIWACAVKLFEDVQKICWPSATQLSIKFQNLTNWSIPLTNWSIPLTTLSTSTSFKIQMQIVKEQFCLTVCWRSWQHDTDFRGCEVELWPPIFEIKSIQHKFWQCKPPRQMKIFKLQNFLSQ